MNKQQKQKMGQDLVDFMLDDLSYGDFWCMRSEEAAHPLL
jgi:hypothetical protein